MARRIDLSQTFGAIESFRSAQEAAEARRQAAEAEDDASALGQLTTLGTLGGAAAGLALTGGSPQGAMLGASLGSAGAGIVGQQAGYKDSAATDVASAVQTGTQAYAGYKTGKSNEATNTAFADQKQQQLATALEGELTDEKRQEIMTKQNSLNQMRKEGITADPATFSSRVNQVIPPQTTYTIETVPIMKGGKEVGTREVLQTNQGDATIASQLLPSTGGQKNRSEAVAKVASHVLKSISSGGDQSLNQQMGAFDRQEKFIMGNLVMPQESKEQALSQLNASRNQAITGNPVPSMTMNAASDIKNIVSSYTPDQNVNTARTNIINRKEALTGSIGAYRTLQSSLESLPENAPYRSIVQSLMDNKAYVGSTSTRIADVISKLKKDDKTSTSAKERMVDFIVKTQNDARNGVPISFPDQSKYNIIRSLIKDEKMLKTSDGAITMYGDQIQPLEAFTSGSKPGGTKPEFAGGSTGAGQPNLVSDLSKLKPGEAGVLPSGAKVRKLTGPKQRQLTQGEFEYMDQGFKFLDSSKAMLSNVDKVSPMWSKLGKIAMVFRAGETADDLAEEAIKRGVGTPQDREFMVGYFNQRNAMQAFVKGNPSDRDVKYMLASTSKITDDPRMNRAVLEYQQRQMKDAVTMKLQILAAENAKTVPQLREMARRHGIPIPELETGKTGDEIYDDGRRRMQANYASMVSHLGEDWQPPVDDSSIYGDKVKDRYTIRNAADQMAYDGNLVIPAKQYSRKMLKAMHTAGYLSADSNFLNPESKLALLLRVKQLYDPKERPTL